MPVRFGVVVLMRRIFKDMRKKGRMNAQVMSDSVFFNCDVHLQQQGASIHLALTESYLYNSLATNQPFHAYN